MYAISKHPQVDFPNTLIDVRYSTVEKTAMQYNDPITDVETPTEELSREELQQKRRRERDFELQKKAEEKIQELFGAQVSAQGEVDRVDARREISAEQWAEAVRRARIKTIQQTKKTIPNAAKLRAARRQLQMKRRNTSQERRQNRQRAK
ncbi:hypothetical protein STCU_11474 [Strigomonas culicis]|uniref:Uncharacterized protein n=1 Tax=Strigomonas culicis TaxID=28005 RepID=S9TH23_9TRYP|nr:hypothetical protein STCU_11474 [Strigomonas culicis]|eukprot:EPY16209.1 hypothetical protein STCU_11474 [Strigomonas culicis]